MAHPEKVAHAERALRETIVTLLRENKVDCDAITSSEHRQSNLDTG